MFRSVVTASVQLLYSLFPAWRMGLARVLARVRVLLKRKDDSLSVGWPEI